MSNYNLAQAVQYGITGKVINEFGKLEKPELGEGGIVISLYVPKRNKVAQLECD